MWPCLHVSACLLILSKRLYHNYGFIPEYELSMLKDLSKVNLHSHATAMSQKQTSVVTLNNLVL